MISVYAVAVVKTEKTAAFETIAQTLRNLSQQDAGCIGYGYGKVQNQADTYAFVEQWQTAADLQNHMAQAHFVQAGKALEDILVAPLRISVVEMM